MFVAVAGERGLPGTMGFASSTTQIGDVLDLCCRSMAFTFTK